MKIEPFEIEERSILAAGQCDFQIMEAEDFISANSRKRGVMEPDYIKMKIKVWDKKGKEGILFDYVPYAPELRWKLGQVLAGTGLSGLAKTGDIHPRRFENMMGKCMIKTEENEGYEMRSKIDSYIKKAKQEEIQKADPALDDEIPF